MKKRSEFFLKPRLLCIVEVFELHYNINELAPRVKCVDADTQGWPGAVIMRSVQQEVGKYSRRTPRIKQNTTDQEHVFSIVWLCQCYGLLAPAQNVYLLTPKTGFVAVLTGAVHQILHVWRKFVFHRNVSSHFVNAEITSRL